MRLVASPDFQDFTQGSSRLQQQLVGSPAVSSVVGVQSVTLPVPDFARSLNLLVTAPANVITLTVTGATTGFTYLNAVPAYDGGIYYLPAMPVVDTQITITWYQVLATAVSIYAIASDEPISVSLFNPVSPTQATSERLVYGMPLVCPVNAFTVKNFTLDSTTRAIRCSVDNPANLLWGFVHGVTSLTQYFDGSPSNTKFPVTPVPVNPATDTAVSIGAMTTAAGPVNLYVAAVNVPDFAGNISLTNPMAANELAPDPKQSQTPNQLAAILDATIPASSFDSLLQSIAGLQYRLHALSVMQYTAVATAFDLQDANGNKFFHYHYSAAANSFYVPLFGQLADRGAGIRVQNTTAVLSGAVCVTLWYSVL